MTKNDPEESGYTASSSGAGAKAAPQREFPEHRQIPAYPEGVRYDAELERLCRIAGSVGGEQAAPISYTALVIAFLFGDDRVSRWFQSYVRDKGVRLKQIFESKNTSEEERDRHLARADSGWLPDADPLYSRSVRNVMEQATRIVRDITKDPLEDPTVCARHVMAAYAFRNPSDHKDQVRGWAFHEEDWEDEFLKFAVRTYPEEEWTRLKGFTRPYIETVSSFTSDDPLAPPRDLLGIENEAAAFARIAAARTIKPPLAIGIFGEWGSGKTFFMRRIYERVEALTKRAKGTGSGVFHTDIVQIRFNAWHYIETNLWASLVEYIFTELDEWLLSKNENARSKADLVFNRLATAQQLKLDALEDMVTRRAERRSAEIRAERARREYEGAVARSAALGAGAYARALIDTFLQQPKVKEEFKNIGNDLGIPQVAQNAGRVKDVIEQARTEGGRAKLIVRSGIAKLGSWQWILSVAVLLIALPLLAVWLKGVIATKYKEISRIQETVLALSSLAAGIAAAGGALVRQASKVVDRIDDFDKKLADQVAAQEEKVKSSEGNKAKEAEDELRKRRQAMEAAERALAEAEAKLTAARQDFESATARNRLNAFIRAKVTEGDYAKHLGIIAAIRRDFGQLATLMDAADSADQRAESRRLAEEAQTRVTGFLKRLQDEPDARLTASELRSLVSLLEPEKAIETLESHGELLKLRLEGVESELDSISDELKTGSNELPRFSRIILYIDDLDRCPPDTVVHVLQAVHLLLSFPLFTVVVAVDARWVSRALRTQFPKLLAETGIFKGDDGSMGAGASSHDYLEKIFQIPYWVRPIDPESATNYVNRLVEPACGVWRP